VLKGHSTWSFEILSAFLSSDHFDLSRVEWVRKRLIAQNFECTFIFVRSIPGLF